MGSEISTRPVGAFVVTIGCFLVLLAVGCWLLAVGCWLLAVGCWLLAVGCWLLAVCCSLLAVGCWLLAVGCWLLAVGVLGCWLCCWLFWPTSSSDRSGKATRKPTKYDNMLPSYWRGVPSAPKAILTLLCCARLRKQTREPRIALHDPMRRSRERLVCVVWSRK